MFLCPYSFFRTIDYIAKFLSTYESKHGKKKCDELSMHSSWNMSSYFFNKAGEKITGL